MKRMKCIDNEGVECALKIDAVYEIDERKTEKIGSEIFYFVNINGGIYYYYRRFIEAENQYTVNLL